MSRSSLQGDPQWQARLIPPHPIDADHAISVIRARCGDEIADAVVPVHTVKAMLLLADELAIRIAALQDAVATASEREESVPGLGCHFPLT
jgi:hypothetical protein